MSFSVVLVVLDIQVAYIIHLAMVVYRLPFSVALTVIVMPLVVMPLVVVVCKK